jgi:glycine/D-amino acid oxidase-like deaminating enzyme
VLAAGAETAPVLARLTGYDVFASRFPLRQVPGVLLTTSPLVPNPLRHLIYTSTTDELHLLPAPNGGIKIGSDDVDALIYDDNSPAARLRAARALLDRADRLIPGLAGRMAPENCQTAIGVRPYPEDGRSIAGALPGADGLYLVATHSGITLAPVLGALMAEYLATGACPAQLAPFALDRFPGFTG